MQGEFDLESLVHVEQTFYDSGYQDGFDHGRIHGLIEGRALGREKGFEMWEELGFYEGFALTWKAIYSAQSRDDDRTANHIRHLLELISQFPRVNPSAVDAASDLDIPKLFRQIRSRYKALCSTLGVRPSLRAAEQESSPTMDEETDPSPSQGESRLKGAPIWKFDNKGSEKQNTGQDLIAPWHVLWAISFHAEIGLRASVVAMLVFAHVTLSEGVQDRVKWLQKAQLQAAAVAPDPMAEH